MNRQKFHAIQRSLCSRRLILDIVFSEHAGGVNDIHPSDPDFARAIKGRANAGDATDNAAPDKRAIKRAKKAGIDTPPT